MRRHLNLSFLALSTLGSMLPPPTRGASPGFASKPSTRGWQPGQGIQTRGEDLPPKKEDEKKEEFKLPTTKEEFDKAIAEAAKTAATAAATEAVEAFKKSQADAADEAKRKADAEKLEAEGKWKELLDTERGEKQKLKDEADALRLETIKNKIVVEFGFTGINAGLAETLTGTDETTLRASATRLAEYKKTEPKTVENQQGAGGGAGAPPAAGSGAGAGAGSGTGAAAPKASAARFWRPGSTASA